MACPVHVLLPTPPVARAHPPCGYLPEGAASPPLDPAPRKQRKIAHLLVAPPAVREEKLLRPGRFGLKAVVPPVRRRAGTGLADERGSFQEARASVKGWKDGERRQRCFLPRLVSRTKFQKLPFRTSRFVGLPVR